MMIYEETFYGRHTAQHYENMPIQTYRRFHLQKRKNFQIKTPIFFIFLLKT